MPVSNHPLFIYACVLEPWSRLAINAPSVAGARISLLPWLWLSDPVKATEEVQRMLAEKNDAWQETSMAITQLPLRFWLDSMVAAFGPDPIKGYYQAIISSSNRIAQPTGSRVRANHKRLSSQ